MAYDYNDGDKFPADPTGPLVEYVIAVYISSNVPSYQVKLKTHLGEPAALRRAHFAAMQSLDWGVPFSDIVCRVEEATLVETNKSKDHP